MGNTFTAKDMNPAIGTAPIAERRPTTRVVHGTELVDEYGWLRDPGYPDVTDKQVLAYLEEENTYFESAMNGHTETVETLFAEFKGRIKEDDESVPVREGTWWYKSTFTAGEDYRRHYRRKADGPLDRSQRGVEGWKAILDETELARGHESFRLGPTEVSPDGTLLAYSTDTDGSERFTIRVKRLSDDTPFDDVISNSAGLLWLPDNRSFLYLELSEQWRPFRVRFHKLGENQDPVIYEEADEGYFVGIDYSQDKRFIFVGTGDHITSEVRIIDPEAPLAEPRLVAERRTGHEYDLDHYDDFFYIRTNDTGKNFRLVRCPADRPGTENWEEIIPAGKTSYIRSHSCFKDCVAIEERIGGIDQVRIRAYDGDEHYVAFPEAAYAAGLDDNREFDVAEIRLWYESMVTPKTIYNYELTTRSLVQRKRQEIPSGYDASQYVTERLEAPARDGTAVPISIVYKRDRPPKGLLHLYAYGAYGYGMKPTFSITQLSLLNRGFAFAVAHIRGGDELGYEWYEAGKLERRTNTFTDFIDCARYLIEGEYTQAGSICISGGSAGGELMGAVMNMAPELWASVVAHVPFVDVLNTMLDESLSLTPMEWNEWGNPIEDKGAFENILSYSPYDQVKAQDYPPTLITAGLNDPWVTYWEPAKWAARLRATKTDGNVLLLKTIMAGGHAGKSGRFTRLRESAEEMTFMLLAAKKAEA